MRKFGIQAVIIGMMLMVTSAFGQGSATQQQVHQAYDQWTHAMETAQGNPKPVVSLYAPKAVLLATLAPRPLTTTQALNDYFTKLTAHKNLKVETKQIITQIFPGIAINSGVYVFSFLDKNNKPVSLEARFSFVYQHSHGQWLIVNHHSSLTPQGME
jgi:uncharacterized protein (TIGR02246 family)